MQFPTLFSKHERVHSPVGDKTFPIFELDKDGELQMTDRKKDVYGEIQSHKHEVLLDNIIRRAAESGLSLEAPESSFGDSTVLPQSLLEAHQNGQRVQSFVDSLSKDDLALLNEQGFDAFLNSKIAAATAVKEVVKEGDKDE